MGKRTPTGWLAWSVCALTLALILCAVALAILNGTNVFSLIYLVAVALSALVGGVVATRRFANPVGWILLAGGAIFAFQEFSLEYAIYGLVINPFSLPLVRTMGWLASWIYVPGLLLLLSFLPLYFPDGRLVSSRWRWVAGLALVLAVVGPISSAFLPSPTRVWDIVYPLGIVGLGPVSDLLDEVATVLYCGVIFASAVSLAVRFHRSLGEEREQIKWLAYAASALTAWLLIDPLIWVDSPILDEVVRPTMDGLLFAGIPVAVGVAVLKYRLYNIDLIINRTLVYGTLTGILALIYLGSVVLLQDIFHALTGQEELSQLAIVLSTVAIAALFIPLRRRIQSFIDRRFYRSKYDARKALEAFSAKLRDEIDLDTLGDNLVEVVRETIQPTHVSLWLRSPKRGGEHTEKATTAIETPDLAIAPDDPILAYLADASGVVEVDKLDLDSPAVRAMKAAEVKLVVPLVSQGELIGLLNLGPRLSQQEYSADDRKLLSDLSTQTAPAVRVAQLVRQHREAETRYRTLVEQTPAITYVQEPIQSDNPKAVTYVSPQYETILGYPAESQMIDEEHWLRTIHPEDRDRVLAEEARTDKTGEPFKVEYRVIAADGRVVWVRDEATLVRDEDGEPLYWLGVQYDITEHKRAEEARTASEIRYRTLVEHLPAITYIEAVDREERRTDLLYVSPQIEAMFGYSPEEWVADPHLFEKLLHPEDRGRVLAEDARTDETGEAFSVEYRQFTRDGRVIWVSDEAVLVKDEEGKPLFWQGVMHDVTGQKRTEDALRQSEELYRSVVEQATESIFLVDIETRRILEANAAFFRSLGYSTGEVKDMTLYDVVAHDRETIDQNIERIVAEGRHFVGERRYRRKDGTPLNVEVSVSTVPYGGREVMCVVAHDVTGRKHAEENLRQSLSAVLALREAGQVLGSTLESGEIVSRLLEIMRSVSNLTAVVISVQDEEGDVTIWRAAGLEGLWHRARFAPEAEDARQAALEDGERRLFRLQHPELEAEHLMGLCLPLRSKERVFGVLEAYGQESLLESATVDTLSSLASQAGSALENALLYEQLEEREQMLQDLVAKLLRAQEEEHRRVAYEVHDGLAQVAAAAHQHLQAFAERFSPDEEKGRRDLDRILRLVRATVTDARRVIANLRPTSLDDLGLAAALSLEVESLREEGYHVDYEERLGDDRLPAAAEISLFRVAQEAMNNVRKHAQTRQVGVELRRQDDEVILKVLDHGRGFDPAAPSVESGPGARVGLAGMRERINMLGGSLKIRSQPGAGTSVVATIDVKQVPQVPLA